LTACRREAHIARANLSAARFVPHRIHQAIDAAAAAVAKRRRHKDVDGRFTRSCLSVCDVAAHYALDAPCRSALYRIGGK
jgi:hypothetical protein